MSVGPLYKRDDATPYSVESLEGGADIGACFAGERELARWREGPLSRALGLIEEQRAKLGPAQIAAATYEKALTVARDAVMASKASADPAEAAAFALQASDSLKLASEAAAPYGMSVPEDAYSAVAGAMARAQAMQPRGSAAAQELSRGPVLAEPGPPQTGEKPPFPWLLVAMTLFGMGT